MKEQTSHLSIPERILTLDGIAVKMKCFDSKLIPMQFWWIRTKASSHEIERAKYCERRKVKLTITDSFVCSKNGNEE